MDETTRAVMVPGEGAFLALVGLDGIAIAALLGAHRGNRDESRRLKDRFGTVVTRVTAGPAASALGVEEVVVKEVPLPWRRRAFHRLGGRSRFRHDFERGRRLETLGVLSPRVLACSLRPCGGSECEISEFVRGGETLREVLWLGGGSLAGAERRRRLLEDVGRWLRRLHELGVWQRDLKPHNVVVRFPAGRAEAGCAEAGRTEIFLLDTTAVRFLGRPLAIGRRTRNLAQVLDVPASLDEEVPPPVLDAYLEGEPALRSEWKSRVARAVERRRRRRQRVDGFRYIDMHLGEQALGARGEVTG